MFKFLLSGNHKLLKSIAEKLLKKCFRKNLGLKTAIISCKDICLMDVGNGRITVHFNGDFELDKTELLSLLDKKIEDA